MTSLLFLTLLLYAVLLHGVEPGSITCHLQRG